MAALVVFAPLAEATPVFDCTDHEVAVKYPAQCPQAADPFSPGGMGNGGGGGGGNCGGLCGIVHGVLHRLHLL